MPEFPKVFTYYVLTADLTKHKEARFITSANKVPASSNHKEKQSQILHKQRLVRESQNLYLHRIKRSYVPKIECDRFLFTEKLYEDWPSMV